MNEQKNASSVTMCVLDSRQALQTYRLRGMKHHTAQNVTLPSFYRTIALSRDTNSLSGQYVQAAFFSKFPWVPTTFLIRISDYVTSANATKKSPAAACATYTVH